jgi:hypothetical protein
MKIHNKNIGNANKNKLSLRSVLRLSSDVIEKLPNKNDGIWSSCIRVLAVGDSIREFFFPSGSKMQALVEELDLKELFSPVIVRLLTNTSLSESLTTNEISLDDEKRILYEKIWKGKSLFLSSGHYGFDSYFYYMADFDFQSLFEELWRLYDNRIVISRSITGVDLGTFPKSNAVLFGSILKRVETLCEKHDQYMQDGVPRSYIFLGEPGTGKTTAAVKMAERNSGKVLRIESDSLTRIEFEELTLLLKSLRPKFVIVDDIDKIEFNNSLAALLSAIEWLKEECPEVAVIFTANRIFNMDQGLFRPGRIDEIHHFPNPNLADRKHIIKGYLEKNNITLPKGYSAVRLANNTDKLSPAWIKEIILQCRYLTPAQAVKYVKAMKLLVIGGIPRFLRAYGRGKNKTPQQIKKHNKAIRERALAKAKKKKKTAKKKKKKTKKKTKTVRQIKMI